MENKIEEDGRLKTILLDLHNEGKVVMLTAEQFRKMKNVSKYELEGIIDNWEKGTLGISIDETEFSTEIMIEWLSTGLEGKTAVLYPNGQYPNENPWERGRSMKEMDEDLNMGM